MDSPNEYSAEPSMSQMELAKALAAARVQGMREAGEQHHLRFAEYERAINDLSSKLHETELARDALHAGLKAVEDRLGEREKVHERTVASVEEALASTWQAAHDTVTGDGNYGWSMVMREAVRLRDAAAQKRVDEIEYRLRSGQK